MPMLNLGDPYTEYTKVPALRKDLEACDEERLDNAIGIIQNSPHLAIGYNRASELYLRKGQGLLATEIYEIGLKAIGKDNPTERSILQKHRLEMKPQYRDFIALLPLEITRDIFHEFDHDFLLETCAMVSAAWFPKVAHNISSITVSGNGPSGLTPVVEGRLLDYIDTLRMIRPDENYLANFFGPHEERRLVGNIERLTIIDCYFNIVPGNIFMDGLTKIAQSLTSLTVDFSGMISPLDLLVICPSLTALRLKFRTYMMSTQTKIPRRDKLASLRIQAYEDLEKFSSDILQRFMPATPNVRFADIGPRIPNVLPLVQKHWPKLQLLYLNTSLISLEEQPAEDGEYLDLWDNGWDGCLDPSALYGFLCQQTTRLRSLNVTMCKLDRQFEFSSIQFQVLKRLTISMNDNAESSKRWALELLRGAVTLKELVLWGVNFYPETFEILTRMPQLECLKLGIAYFPGVNVYLDHLASQGSAAPLKSITIHDYAFDRNQSTTLATRILTLKDITISSSMTNSYDDSWIIHFLNELVRSKSMVERISIPDYTVTRRVLHSLSNLAALQHLTVVEYLGDFDEYFPTNYNFTVLQSRIPHIIIEVQQEHDDGSDMYWYIDHIQPLNL